jgi:Membrane dipeptidase (Peptidase family M19)
VTAVASAGGLIGAWRAGLTSQSLADFADEIIRLTEAAGPGCVAIGTDLDGSYRPVLTSYAQFEDLAGLLRDRGLAQGRIGQILGGRSRPCSAASSPERARAAGRIRPAFTAQTGNCRLAGTTTARARARARDPAARSVGSPSPGRAPAPVGKRRRVQPPRLGRAGR